MTARNREVQATHQLLRLLEVSKEQVDDTLDSLPCLYAVIQMDGRVLRGNELLADLMGVDKELVLNESLQKLFTQETWNLFSSHVQMLSYVSDQRAEFELALDGPLMNEAFQQTIPYLWRLQKIPLQDSNAGLLFNVVGNDISELKKKEARLAAIYSSIPLGILSVDEQGLVTGEHSVHLNWILESHDVAGRNLSDLLFVPSRASLSVDQELAVQRLLALFGKSESEFFELRAQLPSELTYALPQTGGKRYLGVSYQPIVKSGLLRGLLIILEDRTRVVLDRLEKEQAAHEERARLSRMAEVKSCRPDLVQMTLSGLVTSLRDFEEASRRSDSRRMVALVRQMVSLAEIASFTRLQDCGMNALQAMDPLVRGALLAFPDRMELALENLRREVECYVNLGSGDSSLDAVQSPGDGASEHSALPASAMRVGPGAGLRNDEASQMVRSLFDRYTKLVSDGNMIESALIGERLALALDSFSFMPISDIEHFVRAEVASSAIDYAREVRVRFQWEGERVDEPTRLALFNVLLPLLRACVAEGFEYFEERTALGKPRECTLQILISSEFGRLSCQVAHDGRTIGSEAVLRAAVQTEVIKFADSEKLNEDAILQLIFEPEIMKRTVGRETPLLHAVSAVTRYGSQMRVESLKQNAGMRFSFGLKVERKSKVLKSCLLVDEFLQELESSLHSLESSVGCLIRTKLSVLNNRVLLGDRQRLLLSLTTLLGSFAHACEVTLEVTLELGGMLKFRAHNRVSKAASEGGRLPPEFELTLGLCEDYIRQHGGRVERVPDQLVIVIGQLLGDEVLPRVQLDFDSTLVETEHEPLRALVMGAALGMGLKMSSPSEILWGAKSMPVLVTRSRVTGGGYLNLSGATPAYVRRELLELVKSYLGFVSA